MKKLFSFFLCLLITLAIFVPCASAIFDSGAVTSELGSSVYYLENLDEGTVFFEKDSDKKIPPAGFVKLIAAVVALEKWGNLDGEIKITRENLNVFEYQYGMLTVLYEAGETVSKRELFDCLVVTNANDALSVIAHSVSGTEAAFLAEMQSLVGKIGCTSTVLKNIHGFDEEGQYTTAADVARIIKYALEYPAFSEAFGLSEVTLKETDKNEERVYQSSNKMKNAAIADYYHSSVTGGKQTSTDLAGQCIAVSSNADGYSYLCVVMGGELTDIDGDYYDENTSMTDAKRMLEWVYENIRYKVVATADQTIASVDVLAGQGTETLRLVPEKEISALVPAMVTPAAVMFETADKPDSLVAPIKAGEVIATANVYYAGHKLTEMNLVAADSIKLSFVGLMVSALKGIIGSTFFVIVTFICALIAVVKFLLDLKDFFDKERRKSYDPLPSSFEVLTEKITGVFRRKKTKKNSAKKKPSKKSGDSTGKPSASEKPVANRKAVSRTSPQTGKKPPVKKTAKPSSGAKNVPGRQSTATKNTKRVVNGENKKGKK